jgi:hypothetical protein
MLLIQFFVVIPLTGYETIILIYPAIQNGFADS